MWFSTHEAEECCNTPCGHSPGTEMRMGIKNAEILVRSEMGSWNLVVSLLDVACRVDNYS